MFSRVLWVGEGGLAKMLLASKVAVSSMRLNFFKTLLARGASEPKGELRYVDGLAVPSEQLVEWVTGQRSLEVFLESGKLGAQALELILGRASLALGAFDSVLDFGCGCGRVLRFLRGMEGVSLQGTDLNRKAIAWAAEHLGFATFVSNALEPPLRYGDGSFGLVYAFSVFTHLPEALQFRWMRELHRVLGEDGYLIITVHGDHYLPHVPEGQRSSYERGDLVVRHSKKAGRNECAAFHPARFVRERLAPETGFEVVAFIEEGALGNPKQDIYLLKRV